LIPVELAAQIIISDKQLPHQFLCARLQQVGFTSKVALPEYISAARAQIFKDFIAFSEGRFWHTVFRPEHSTINEIKRIGRFNPIFITDNGGVLFEDAPHYKYIHGTEELNFNIIWVTVLFLDNGITYTPFETATSFSREKIYYKIITQQKLSVSDIRKHLLRTNFILPDQQMTINLEKSVCTLSRPKLYFEQVDADNETCPDVNSSRDTMVVSTYGWHTPTFDIWTIQKDGIAQFARTITPSNLTFKGNCETTKSVFGNVYVEQRDNEKLSFFDCINGKHICSLYVEGKHLVAFGYDKLVLKDAYGDIEVWNLGELTGSKIPALANYKTSEPTIFALTKNAQLKLLEQKKIN
jgi:hypothetical protein